MKKQYADLNIRTEFEPNRFSADYLITIYEQLEPLDPRSARNEHKNKEDGGKTNNIAGGEK